MTEYFVLDDRYFGGGVSTAGSHCGVLTHGSGNKRG